MFLTNSLFKDIKNDPIYENLFPGCSSVELLENYISKIEI